MKIVVGLGNPGLQYRRTRHNIGFEVLAKLSDRYDGGKPRQKFDAELVEVNIGGEKTLLLAPATYMNESGRAVRQAAAFYDESPENLLVVCDDMNLDTGRLRLRASGSAGGQKGLANIIQHLGTEEFARLRVGIGRPPGKMDASNYVLGKFTANEREEVDPAVERCADGVELWIREGVAAAMNAVNAPLDEQ